MDIIVADWVLEHVLNPVEFSSEIYRVLKPGGIFCARTPHKYKYVSLFATLLKNKLRSKALNFIQPQKKEQDTFPTAYKLNTLKTIKKNFKNYKNFNYLYTSHPSYYANNEVLFKLLNWLHKVLPAVLVSEIFIFLKKSKN